jgi:hypothetical protein
MVVAGPSPTHVRESSLHVTNTTYSGLQEHRIIVYTATGQKAQPKVHLAPGWPQGQSHVAPGWVFLLDDDRPASPNLPHGQIPSAMLFQMPMLFEYRQVPPKLT